MNKRMTILDVAKHSGVGKSTVSRVINNDGKVKEETRLKVQESIDSLGFVPSKNAQQLRGKEDKVVGVIVTRLDSASESTIVRSIMSEANKSDTEILIMESQFDSNIVKKHLDVLKMKNITSVIVFSFSELDVEILKQWKGNMVTMPVRYGFSNAVIFNDEQIIYTVLNTLESKNIRNISYIGVDESDKTTGFARTQAFKKWMTNHGLPAKIVTGGLDRESGYHLVDEVLNDKTQAIVCASDSIALGVVKRLNELNRTRITVTGVGGSELLSFMFPSIISPNPGYEEAGELALKLVSYNRADRIDNFNVVNSPSVIL